MSASSTGPRPTPSIPTGGLFSPYAESPINASPSALYNALLDTATWPKWSTFVPKADITHQPSGEQDSSILLKGTKMTFNVQMTPSMKTASKEFVSLVGEPPKDSDPAGTKYRICWEAAPSLLMPSMMLHAERVNEIERCEDGTCFYRTWETFEGPVARVVRWSFEQTLQARFEDWVRELKAFVETP